MEAFHILSILIFALLVYLEICPKYDTDTYLRKLAIFSLLIIIVAKA